MSKNNFISDVISGIALILDIDDYIEEWHESDSKLEIYQFLGMTQEEYRIWVEDESRLKDIIRCHMSGLNISTIIENDNSDDLKMIARAKNPQEAKEAFEVIRKHKNNNDN